MFPENTLATICLRRWVLGASLATACVLAACSPKPTTEAEQTAAPQPHAQPVAPTPDAAQAGGQAPMDAAAASASGRKVAVNAQAISPMGLTVRVKQIELADDATVLTVSLSLGGDNTIFTSLVDKETYLLDESGNKLLPKLPPENRFLRVRKGETLEGELVFMGALPANARQVELVINDGNAPDNSSGPSMRLRLPIGAA